MIVSAFHINGVEIDKDFNGDQITLLVVSIRTKNGQSKKEETRYIYILILYLFQVFVTIHTEKMAI